MDELKTFLTEEEYNNAPDYIKERCIPEITKQGYFIIGISVKDCTGCGLCVKSCPGKANVKALELDKLEIRENEQKIFDYLNENIKPKPQKIENLKTIQFKNPKFQFHGACAGCGETSYIKILTQMYGENLEIANATGCSSIYGGSLPSTPFTIPWTNSLFEDNAEFGYGILNATNFKRNKIRPEARSLVMISIIRLTVKILYKKVSGSLQIIYIYCNMFYLHAKTSCRITAADIQPLHLLRLSRLLLLHIFSAPAMHSLPHRLHPPPET